MQVAETVQEVREIRQQEPLLVWGLVPTMGALHAGHLALVRQATDECERVGVSIFVNPTQFNDSADLTNYPRTLQEDLSLLGSEGVDLVWVPQSDHVYPPGFQTSVTLSHVTQPLEGTHRPGHFAGVATIVAKLFNIFEPTYAYFGQKDAQQVAVIKQMVRDLNFNLEIVTVPTVRADDGLALSSRNKNLSTEQRRAAVVLSRALFAAKSAWEQGARDAEYLRQHMMRIVGAEPLARIDYISVAHPWTLEEQQGIVKQALLSMAVYIGETRLIDNITVGD